MVVHTLPLGQLQTNCYILHKENCPQCLILDPGGESQKVLDFLKDRALQPQAILLTHGHFDHVGAVRPLAESLQCPVYLCEEDCSLPGFLTAGPLFYTHSYREPDTLQLAGLTLSVLQTPGHTPGSVCLAAEDALFTGDTLFAGSCGRMDFPGGSPADMGRSLRRLAGLEKNYTLYPGHGEASTLEQERLYNPYLKGIL